MELGAQPETSMSSMPELTGRSSGRVQSRRLDGRLGLPPDIPIILFVGNLVPVKGLDVLVEACSILKKVGLKYHCLLIGGAMRAIGEPDRCS